MNRRIRKLLVLALAPIAVLAALAIIRPAAAAGLTRVTSFGNNPTNLNMYVYTPNNLASKPALLLLVHFCGGSASSIFNGNGHDYVNAADKYGFAIVLPEATRTEKCFDVATPNAQRRNGGSDSTGIMSMVSWARSRYNVDPARIVVSGFSSGAMMTNLLAAQYPDVFSAASAFSGVPAGCFSTGGSSLWNSTCSGGKLIKTAQQWGDQARAMYPGYTGKYPRIQLWHGTTDSTLAYPNFGEEIKQWTNLHKVSSTPVSTDKPQSSWTRTRYGSGGTQATIEGISISGVGHALPMSGQLAYAVSFLGLDRAGGTTTPVTTPATTAPPSTAGTLVSSASGRCLDRPGGTTTNGAQPIVYDCSGGTNQRWTSNGKALVGGGKCLDSPTNAGSGAKSQIWDCTGATNQQWNMNSNGTVSSVASGLCLETSGAANGSTVSLRTCNSGNANQRWTRR